MNLTLQVVVVVVTSQSWIEVMCTFDVHHIPVLHLNINQFAFSCSTGIVGMRHTWLMYTSDFLRSAV